ncbi:MAG: phosphate/phosphite/phosphonate ABC transporter substrate-binding protein [Desulfobacteraceae bacterium]|nr:phosphate/phosphite/phosphonate ABC transporter substrate-binding protein [Desulfobacteraceae bacterium]
MDRIKFVFVTFILMSFTALFVTPATQAGNTLSFGVIPLEKQDIMFKKFVPLAKYLEKELGIEVNLVIGKGYQESMDAIGTNKVQIAYLTPTTYPKSKRQNPDADIRSLVRFQSKGHGTYRSCIIVPIDGESQTIEDLKGQKFAFGSKNSTSSHLMPRSMLAAKGIQFEDIQAEYLGSHSSVAAAVSAEQFYGGGVKESVAEKYVESEEVRILAKSDPIPEFPICINKHVSAQLEEKILAAFKKLNNGSDEAKKVMTAINKKYTGVEDAKDADYDVIRTMIQNLYGDAFYKK